MAYLKPQSPLKKGEDYIYPITTVDQVITDNGERLDSVVAYLDSSNTEDGLPESVNADTLGGKPASDYATKEDLENIQPGESQNSDGNAYTLLWENPNPTANFAAQTISINATDYDFVGIITKLATGEDYLSEMKILPIGTLAHTTIVFHNTRNYPQTRTVKNITATSITFEGGRNVDTDNDGVALPYQIYGIKKGGSASNSESSSKSFVTPEMYGAKRDGISDDGPAFEAALNSGYPVKLSRGDNPYRITSVVTVSRVSAKLMCDTPWHENTGKGAIVQLLSGGSFCVNEEYFVCEGVYFYSNNTDIADFVLNGPDNLNVDAEFYNCVFSGGYAGIQCNGRGLKVDGSLFARVTYATILNYVGTTEDGTITTDKTYGGRGFVITNNRYHSGVTEAVMIPTTGSIIDMLFTGNLSDHYGAGIVVYGALRDSIVSNNIFANCQDNPISVGNSGILDGVKFIGNEFNSRATVGLNYAARFFLASSGATTRRLMFCNNTFDGTQYQALAFANQEAEMITITGNQFDNIDMVGDNTTYAAISLPPTSKHIIVTDNVFGFLAATATGCAVRTYSVPVAVDNWMVQHNVKVYSKDIICHAQVTAAATNSSLQS